MTDYTRQVREIGEKTGQICYRYYFFNSHPKLLREKSCYATAEQMDPIYNAPITVVECDDEGNVTNEKPADQIVHTASLVYPQANAGMYPVGYEYNDCVVLLEPNDELARKMLIVNLKRYIRDTEKDINTLAEIPVSEEI